MHQKFKKQTFGEFLLLGMLMIGIITLSGCIGQEEEGNRGGSSVILLIKPNPLIPSRTTYYTLTDYWLHTSWAGAIADDGSGTSYNWTAGKTRAINQIFWEWDVGYPRAMKQIAWEVDINGGNPLDHQLNVYNRDGSITNIFYLNTSDTGSGNTVIDEQSWINGKVYAEYWFEEVEGDLWVYSVTFDVMRLEFESITETHYMTRISLETAVTDVLSFEIKQNDVTVTITNIPEGYTLKSILPENSYLDYTDNIVTENKVIITGCVKGSYEVVFDTGST